MIECFESEKMKKSLGDLIRILLVGLAVFMFLTGGSFAFSPPPEKPTQPVTPEAPVIQPMARVDWPMFKGDAAHGGESAEMFIKPPLSIKWVFLTGGNIWSSPAVVGSMCYVGSSDGKLYAINIKTGESVWEFKTADAIYSSPAVGRGLVYVGSLDRKLYAVDARSGDVKWSVETGEPITSSPCVADGIVYFGSWDGNLYALDAESGAVKWKYGTGGPIYSSPAVYQGNVYFGSSDGKVYALDKDTGKIIWVYQTGDYVSSSPCISDRIVYIGSWDKNLYALSCKTGSVIWKFKADEGIYVTPAVSGSLVVFASYGGNLYAANKERGYLQWSYNAKGSAYHSSPVIANNIIYIGLSYKNKIQAFNLKGGEYLWSYLTDASVGATAAISHTMLFIASSDGKVYAFGDIQQPTAKVEIEQRSAGKTNFLVRWSGIDEGGSLVQSFDIQYKEGAGEEWRNWLTNVTSTSAVFGPDQPVTVKDGRTYYFQARAKDNAGNVGNYAGGEGDVYVTVDLSPPNIIKVDIDGSTAVQGGYISPQPTVYARIIDNVGVDPDNVFVIVDKIKHEPDSFEKGELRYKQKEPLLPGPHSISISAADVSGNLARVYAINNLKVLVGVEATNMRVTPDPFNPLAGPTYIYYSLNASANVMFYIYDKFGSIIYSRKFTEGAPGGKEGYNKIEWKGVLGSGAFVQNGEYTFKLIANKELVAKGTITVQK